MIWQKYSVVVVILILSVTVYASSPRYTIIHEPAYQLETDNTAIFKFTSQQRFSKMGKKGGVEWSIPLSQKRWSLIGVRFNRLFFKNTNGELACFDATYGYKLWGPIEGGLKKVILSYPTVIAQSTTNQLIAIDFFSGQVLWKKKLKQQSTNLLEVSQKYHIMISDKTGLSLIDIATGQVKTKKRLATIYDSAEEIENGILYRKKNNLLYWIPETKKLHNRRLKKEEILIAIKGKIGLVYKKTNHELVLQDMITKKIKWVKKITDQISIVEDSAASLVGIINHQTKLFSLISLKDTTDTVLIKEMIIKKNMQLKGMKKINSHVILIYPKQWIHINIESTNG